MNSDYVVFCSLREYLQPQSHIYECFQYFWFRLTQIALRLWLIKLTRFIIAYSQETKQCDRPIIQITKQRSPMHQKQK